jgi:hypothetical protein
MFDKANTYKQPRLRELALDILLQLPVTALTRKERESVVDKICAQFKTAAGKANIRGNESVIPDTGMHEPDSMSLLLKDLSVMIRSMEQRIPTSTLVRAYIVPQIQLLTSDSAPMLLKSGILPFIATSRRLQEIWRGRSC